MYTVIRRSFCAFMLSCLSFAAPDPDVIMLEGVGSNGFNPQSLLIKDEKIFSVVEGGIYIHALDGSLLEEITAGKNEMPIWSSFVLDVYDSMMIVKTLYTGKSILLKYAGKSQVAAKTHYPTLEGIFITRDGKYILVGGMHYTNFMNVMNDWQENMVNAWRENPNLEDLKNSAVGNDMDRMMAKFYSQNTAYTLTKYDLEFNLIDTCDLIGKKGEDASGYQNLWPRSREKFARDIEGNIYVFHRAEDYLVRKYSPDFGLLAEFRGENDHFKPLPKKMTRDIATRLNNTMNSHSVVYAMYALDSNKVFIGFWGNFGRDWKKYSATNPPIYFDIYTDQGEKIASGTTPEMVYTSDVSGNLYFLIKREGSWFFGKPQYYLIPFTVDELIEGGVDEKYIENAISQFIKRNG